MIGKEMTDGRSVPFTLADHINQLCDGFESAWRAGRRPRLEDCLIGVAGPEHVSGHPSVGWESQARSR
jgi:hypothetical protein